jgi:hypothetical protein
MTPIAIPTANNRVTTKWYDESSHFTRAVGNLILDRIFDYHDPTRRLPTDFGASLDFTNIERHIARIRDGQQRDHETLPGISTKFLK